MSGILKIQCWGVRGNMGPAQPSIEYGIHTTCVEVGVAGFPSALVDMGSGAIPAAVELMKRNVREFDIFQTHLHMDHLQGLFAFAPFYRSGNVIRWRSARPDLEANIRALHAPPLHPLTLDQAPAKFEFAELPERGSRYFPYLGMTVSWEPLAHPQGCTGFRFDSGDSAIVFATDVELDSTHDHSGLERLLREPYPAGLLIIDGMFMNDEMAAHRGWGHSSWTEGLAMARRCGVENVQIFHHHYKYTDADLRAIEQAAAPVRWARENTVTSLCANRLA